MGYQDDYVMRTISDLVRAIARLALGKNEINYALPDKMCIRDRLSILMFLLYSQRKHRPRTLQVKFILLR